VARRLRYDSGARRPQDFQAAVDHWAHALSIDPNQYIWRRRIQQYGPRMDKPYPFYSWIDEARRDLLARGEEPVPLLAELTPSERAEPLRGFAGAGDAGTEPDPEGKVHADDGLVSVETAVAFDTSRKEPVASVHVTFRPNPERRAHWNNEVAPMVVWFGTGETPSSWQLGTRWVEEPGPESATSTEARRFTIDVRLDEVPEGLLEGYALFHACEDVGGECVYLREDFRVPLARPE